MFRRVTSFALDGLRFSDCQESIDGWVPKTLFLGQGRVRRDNDPLKKHVVHCFMCCGYGDLGRWAGGKRVLGFGQVGRPYGL